MTDRELLELAARAANVDVKLIKRRNTAVCEGDDYYEDLPEDRWYFVLKDFSQKWNPLTDDGDALRLAVKLGIIIEYRREVPACFAYHYALHLEVREPNASLDPYAATRRAIIRSAAEIGRSMK